MYSLSHSNGKDLLDNHWEAEVDMLCIPIVLSLFTYAKNSVESLLTIMLKQELKKLEK